MHTFKNLNLLLHGVRLMMLLLVNNFKNSNSPIFLTSDMILNYLYTIRNSLMISYYFKNDSDMRIVHTIWYKLQFNLLFLRISRMK